MPLSRSCLLLVALWSLAGAVVASAVEKPRRAQDGVELLRDPTFTRGITQGFANHLKPAERADCLTRWNAKGMRDADWIFWEISEQLYFAHNPATPVVKKPGQFTFTTIGDAKQCSVDDGVVRLRFDSGKDWREGGNLSLPDKSGAKPTYGNPRTTWPHFLFGQQFGRKFTPGWPADAPDLLGATMFERLRFTADVKLNQVVKSSTWDHKPDYGAPNHAIFYIGFMIRPLVPQGPGRGIYYVLVPAIYSEGDNRHLPQSCPWLGLDQHGEGVYFSGSQPSLQVDTWVRYDIDVKALVREALAVATKDSATKGRFRHFRAEDYGIEVLLIGWEIWGGFATDVEIKNLSLVGTP